MACIIGEIAKSRCASYFSTVPKPQKYRLCRYLSGKVIAYGFYKDDFSKEREKAYQKGLAGIRDYDDILHYINWKTPRISMISNKIESGIYAGNNNWNRDVRQVYGELAFDGAAKQYTDYALSFGKSKLIEVAQKLGIIVPSFIFESKQEGMDSNGKLNKEYVILAEN